MRRLAIPFCCALLLVGLSGCQSPWVQATVVNDQDTPVNLVEVNYPGGSFGIQSIAAHSNFRYRFHILLNDAITMDFTDAASHNHTAKGPQLNQGEAGTLRIAIEADNTVLWTPALARQK
jgi:hypothetical protein